jgi:peptide/nickel transport system permease protein
MILTFGTPEEKAALRHSLYLDRDVFTSYIMWFSHFIRGDMGLIYGIGGGETVWSHVTRSLPISLLIMFYTQIIALVIAIPLGIFTAYRAGKKSDRIISNTLFTSSSIPNFALAFLLIIVVGVKLKWFPTLEYIGFKDNPFQHFKHLVLPCFSLGLGLAASYTRLLRTDVIAALKDDYVTMAASKGLSDARILLTHVFRPASVTLLTAAALNMGALIGGTLVIETIFAIPGFGFEIAYALGTKEFVALQSFIAITAIGYVIFNVTADILIGIVDPRTRGSR